MYKIIIYFLVLLLAVNSNVTNGQLNDIEYNCTLNLYESYAMGGASKFTIDPTSKKYNFCKVGSMSMCNPRKSITKIIFTQDSSAPPLKSSDFGCLQNLLIITIDGFNLDKNFLLGNFYNFRSLAVILNNGNTSSAINFDRFNSTDNSTNFINIQSLTISSALSKSETVYLSNYRNIPTLELLIQPFLDFKTVLINDLSNDINSSVTKWIFYTSNIPQLNMLSISELSFYFYPIFDNGSFSNFSTIDKTGIINLYSLDRSVYYPFPSSLSNTTKTAIVINYSIETPKPLIDLSFKSFSLIKFIGVGSNFTVDGFPISKFSNSLTQFVYQDSDLKHLPDFEIFKPTIGVINFINSNIGGYVPKSLEFNRYPLLTELVLTGNQLEGGIDSSWCNFDFDIRNNLINGSAPSCVTCHYYSDQDRVSGNSFDNLTPVPPCTTIILNLSFNTTTKEYRLWGKDLGWDPTYFSSNETINARKIIPNEEFIFPQNVDNRPKVFTFKFPFTSTPNTPYEVAVYNDFSPLINEIYKYGDIFIISGSYFSYDRDYVSVNISNYECYLLSCNFTAIQCIVIDGINVIDSLSTINGSVKIMDTQSDFSFARIEICGGGNCPSNGCTGNGKLNNTTGLCDCSATWFGKSCEFLKKQCKNDCGSDGHCDYIKTGECICDPRISFVNYHNCSGRSCINSCNNGTCNTNDGTCGCDIEWTGAYCTTPNHTITGYSFNYYQNNPNVLNVTINGWFGGFHQDIEIKIGGLKCDVIDEKSNEIQCLINFINTTDPKTLTVTQNTITKTWDGRFYFKNINDGYSGSDLETSSSSNEQENSDPNRIKKIILVSILPIAAVCLVIGTIILVVKIKVNKGMIPLKNSNGL